MKKRIKEAPWYAYAVAACIAVVLLVILMLAVLCLRKLKKPAA